MPLIADQKTKRKQALSRYYHNVRSVVKGHKQRIVSLVEEADTQKRDAIRRKIQEK